MLKMKKEGRDKRMEIAVEGCVTRDDFAEASHFLGEKINEKYKEVEPPYFGFFHMLVVGLVIGVVLGGVDYFGIYSFRLDPLTALVVVMLISFVAIFLSGLYKSIPKTLPSEDGAILGKHKYVIHDDGFVEETDYSKTTMNWRGIRSVEETSSQIYIFIDTHLAFFIPKRFFYSKENSREFFEALRERVVKKGSRHRATVSIIE